MIRGTKPSQATANELRMQSCATKTPWNLLFRTLRIILENSKLKTKSRKQSYEDQHQTKAQN